MMSGRLSVSAIARRTRGVAERVAIDPHPEHVVRRDRHACTILYLLLFLNGAASCGDICYARGRSVPLASASTIGRGVG